MEPAELWVSAALEPVYSRASIHPSPLRHPPPIRLILVPGQTQSVYMNLLAVFSEAVMVASMQTGGLWVRWDRVLDAGPEHSDIVSVVLQSALLFCSCVGC